jgi:hypothetical protein
MVVLAVLIAAEGAPLAAARDGDPPRITIAVMPQGMTPGQLATVKGMAVGLMSAGIGSVPQTQTYIDIGQGARISSVLYDDPLPLVYTRPGIGSRPTRIPPRIWEQVRVRADSAPADLVPGLLGSALEAAGVGAHSDLLAGPAAAIVADRRGRVPEADNGSRPQVDVVGADLARIATLTARLADNDLLIAIERPPPAENRALAIGVAGSGFNGTLTSDSTRMRGYVVSTDVAPTILGRLGLAVPDQMTGEQLRGEGTVEPDFLRRLGNRLAVIGPRRGPVIGTNLLIWVALTALAGIGFGPRGLRAALPLLAVTLAYLPAVLLLTAALEPSELAERLITGLGCPALALLTLRLVPGLGGLAIGSAVSVLVYAVDVIAGSHLTELSLIGPNPAAGIRFYGVGNELEATVGALVPIATGAGLAAWAPRASPRAAALAFAGTALLAVAAFAPGRFGADVGAAIGIPIGAAVAVGACLGRATSGWRRTWLLALLIAAPILVLAALAAVDLLLAGDAHLTRSVLRAGGFDQLSEVAQRRLQLSVHSFGRYAQTAMLWITAVVIVAGIVQRRRVEAWFGDRPWAWAGFLGAVAATVAGTLANDSGALLLMIGAAYAAATVGLAWATTGGRSSVRWRDTCSARRAQRRCNHRWPLR